VARKADAGVGMNIDDVLRTQQTGIIEVSGLEIKCVKRLLLSAIGIGIAAGHVRF
jgi:hypothetical protein